MIATILDYGACIELRVVADPIAALSTGQHVLRDMKAHLSAHGREIRRAA